MTERVLMLLCAAILTTSLFSCTTEDMTDDTLLPEETVIEEPAPPEPSWADGIVTITIGNYQKPDDLIRAISNKKNMSIRRSTPACLKTAEANIAKSMVKEKKVVDITMLTLEEAGFTEPVTLEEILERFEQLGYRPLTIEEVLELRLQFTDQPDMTRGDLTEEARAWSDVIALLSVEDALALYGNPPNKKLLNMYRASARDSYGEGFGLGAQIATTFDPSVKNMQVKFRHSEIRTGSSFVCAIVK